MSVDPETLSTSIQIAVVGGGPAGLAAALHLAQLGHACTVFESRKREMVMLEDPGEMFDLRGRSYAISLRERAHQLLTRLEPQLLEDLKAKGLWSPSFWMSRSVNEAPTSLGAEANCLYTTRDAIIKVMTDLIQAKWKHLVSFCYDHRLQSMVKSKGDSSDSYVLNFTNGNKYHAKVVLGTDGMNSLVRAYLETCIPVQCYSFTDPSPVKFFLIPPNDVITKEFHVMVRKGTGNCMVLPFVDGSSTGVILPDPKQKEIDGKLFCEAMGPPTEQQEQELQLFFEKHFPQILKAFGNDKHKEFFHDLVTAKPFRGQTIWCERIAHGRVVLLGDAAHATLYTTGQGCSAALLDAELIFKGKDGKPLWDGKVESAASAFASFSSDQRDNRRALFETGKWVASNRWNYKYLIFMFGSKFCAKANEKFPWLVQPPLYACFNDEKYTYIQAWEIFCRHGVYLKIMFAMFSLLVIYLVQAGGGGLYNSGVIPHFCIALPILSHGVLSNPHHFTSRGKHLTYLAHHFWSLQSTKISWVSWPALLAFTAAAHSLFLVVSLWTRESSETFRPLFQERQLQMAKMGTKPRIYMWLGMGALYTLYSAPLLFACRAHVEQTGSTSALSVVLAWILMLVGFAFQIAGDLTKQAHHASGPKGPVKNGVFTLCRHPNYFGEILVWTSYWIALWRCSGGFVVCMLCVLLKVMTMLGSTKKLEEDQRKKYGPDPYFENTPVLMPFVPLYTLLGKDKEKAKQG